MEETLLGPANQPASSSSVASESKRDVVVNYIKFAVGHLAEAIDKLPTDERLVLSLHYHDELNFEEIGLVLDLPELEVHSIYQRALTRLGFAFSEVRA